MAIAVFRKRRTEEDHIVTDEPSYNIYIKCIPQITFNLFLSISGNNGWLKIQSTNNLYTKFDCVSLMLAQIIAATNLRAHLSIGGKFAQKYKSLRNGLCIRAGKRAAGQIGESSGGRFHGRD